MFVVVHVISLLYVHTDVQSGGVMSVVSWVLAGRAWAQATLNRLLSQTSSVPTVFRNISELFIVRMAIFTSSFHSGIQYTNQC